MNRFERIKEEVSVIQAAEHYGLSSGQNRMVRCPFHEDHTPSMMLYKDHYHCFGCGAHGDVIDLTAGLFELSIRDAAAKLAYDFHIDPDGPKPAVMKLPRKKNEELFVRSLLKEYLCLLERYHHTYAPQTPVASADSRYVTACRQIPYIAYLIDCMDTDPQETLRTIKAAGLHHRIAQALDREDSGREAA